jgi:hypothetical protein
VEKHLFANIVIETADHEQFFLGAQSSENLWEHLFNARYIDKNGKVQDLEFFAQVNRFIQYDLFFIRCVFDIQVSRDFLEGCGNLTSIILKFFWDVYLIILYSRTYDSKGTVVRGIYSCL